MLPDLYRSALSLCHGPTTAEDLVRDTCVKAIVSCDKPDSEKITANHAWLKKILLNTLLLTAITLALIALPNLVGIMLLRRDMKQTVRDYWWRFDGD
jgi:hypothetical protein